MRRILLTGYAVIAAIGLVWLGTLVFPTAGRPAAPATALTVPGERQAAAEAGDPCSVWPKGIPVLMYHSVGPEKGNDTVIAKERFA